MEWQPVGATALVFGLSVIGPQAMAQASGSSFAVQTAPAPAPAPKTPAPRPRAKSVPRPGLAIQVTDPRGVPLGDVHVELTGNLGREGTTDTQGELRFTNLRNGTYRLRFERDGFITLERDVTLPAVAAADVVLTPAPPVNVVAAPPPAPERKEPAEAPRPVGEPRLVAVPAYTEKNFIGRSEPQKLSVLGCTGYSTTRLLQLRDPMDNRVNDDADETLYVVAGEATLRLNGADQVLAAGSLAVIPRGTTHSLVRRGRNPAIFVSVLSGPACGGL
jgi:mannose-6-phosphate isomerase-like protein (cupin superfamily)